MCIDGTLVAVGWNSINASAVSNMMLAYAFRHWRVVSLRDFVFVVSDSHNSKKSSARQSSSRHFGYEALYHLLEIG